MMIFFVRLRPAQYTILTTFTLTRLCLGQLFSPAMDIILDMENSAFLMRQKLPKIEHCVRPKHSIR